MPDAHEGVGAQERHDLLAERQVEAGSRNMEVTLTVEREQQPLHARRVVQHPLLQPGDARQPLGLHHVADAPPERGGA